MSTTAVRMNTHAPSPSYVPRTASRPNSPALPPRPQLTYPPSNTSNSRDPNASSERPGKPHGYGHARSSSTSRLDSPSFASSSRAGAGAGAGAGGSGLGLGLGAGSISPGLGSAPTPRLGGMERSSSGLRNEVRALPSRHRDEPQSRSRLQRASGDDEAAKEAAQAILKILSSLPAPLPETLPPTFLPTPAASPSSSTNSASPTKTFREYARSSMKRKLSSSSARSDSDSDSEDIRRKAGSGSGGGLGIGLGLSMSPENRKKQKIEGGSQLTRSTSNISLSASGRDITPSNLPGSSPATSSKKLGHSALRNEVEAGEIEQGKESWSREKWREAAHVYRARALLLKRHGDAYQRTHSAHPQYTSILPHDPVKGLLCLTDAVLLWLYAYFCEEQGGERVRSSPYNESAPLREFVRRGWESEMRKAPEEGGRREMARAMVGLMHLIEAVVGYHLTAEQLAHLSRRGRELVSSTTPTNHGPSPGSTTSASPPGTAPLPPSSTGGGGAQHHVSPAGRSSSSSSHHSPDSHVSYSLPPHLLPLISTSTSLSSRAAQHLLTSRHHLSLKLLKTWFPRTFEYALTSELNDEALPVPGDNLGNARKVDVDLHPEKFAWPIELGMCAPVAHTTAFGRCLVEEAADNLGKDWVRILE